MGGQRGGKVRTEVGQPCWAAVLRERVLTDDEGGVGVEEHPPAIHRAVKALGVVPIPARRQRALLVDLVPRGEPRGVGSVTKRAVDQLRRRVRPAGARAPLP